MALFWYWSDNGVINVEGLIGSFHLFDKFRHFSAIHNVDIGNKECISDHGNFEIFFLIFIQLTVFKSEICAAILSLATLQRRSRSSVSASSQPSSLSGE